MATSVGGVPQVITDGVNGLLVPPGDPDALANSISRLVADPALADRLGRAAREGGASFDVARASAEIEALYAELLTPPG